MKRTKYIVILGSIMSGLGKGILTASLLKILSLRGLKVLPLKFDGYLNVDCGTMNPFRHGEVFVLKDGSEVDMDFGEYERFLGEDLKGESSLTGGKIFKSIIEKERRGDYLGEDVQFIPHVTDFIKKHIRRVANDNSLDVLIIEVGGTVGDIENQYFIEAMRQLSNEEEVLFIQLTYLPELKGLLKTKPTQHANKLIQSLGVKPSIIIARTNKPLGEEIRKKLSLFCNVEEDSIFEDPELSNIYELPLFLESQGIFEKISKYLDIEKKTSADWSDWKRRVENMNSANENKKSINIGIIGKYTGVSDAYVSIEEALRHSQAELSIKVEWEFIDSSSLEKSTSYLGKFDGIIIPGGFGSRGIEGKIKAIEYARKNEVPLLGICLGMQLMIVEYARNVAGLNANSLEFDDKVEHDVITLLPEQRKITKKGATMRLGDYEMDIREGTLLYEIYGRKSVVERHRHRYEVNPKYVDILEKNGLVISATHKGIVEAVEYKNRKAVGLQSHPELTSKFEKPSPVFLWLVRESHNYNRDKNQE